MRKYELTYLVSDEVPENDLNKVTGKVTGLIDELGGKIDKEDIWGRRKLIYSIKKQDFATYVTLFFSLPAEKAIEFEKDLHHVNGVIRQLMIVREYGEDKISLSAEEIAETKDIEKAIGGEKSFEAVLGRTEESRDLMAKREKEEAAEEEVVEKAEPEKESEAEAEETEPTEETEVKEEKTAAKPKAKKETKKTAAKVADEEEVIKPKTKAKKESSDEAERLSKLNEELDDILKDEL